jgi:hypothetical protein
MLACVSVPRMLLRSAGLRRRRPRDDREHGHDLVRPLPPHPRRRRRYTRVRGSPHLRCGDHRGGRARARAAPVPQRPHARACDEYLAPPRPVPALRCRNGETASREGPLGLRRRGPIPWRLPKGVTQPLPLLPLLLPHRHRAPRHTRSSTRRSRRSPRTTSTPRNRRHPRRPSPRFRRPHPRTHPLRSPRPPRLPRPTSRARSRLERRSWPLREAVRFRGQNRARS